MITSNIPYVRNIVVNYWFLSLPSLRHNYSGPNNLIKIFFLIIKIYFEKITFMNKNARSISWTKKPQAKVAKGKTTKKVSPTKN